MEQPTLKSVAWLGLLASLAACDQTSQNLPFEVEGETIRTITADGGTISSPAGVSLTVPAGAFSGPTTVTLGQVQAPAGVPGSPTSSAFSIESSGSPLGRAAQLEIRLAETADPALAWMASIVGTTGGGFVEYPGGRVDLSTGVVWNGVDGLGTFVAVIPPPEAIFPVQEGLSLSRSAALSLPAFVGVTIDSIAVDCGDAANRCGGVSARASGNLLRMVSASALLYPHFSGTLRIGEESVTGSINARATMRILLGSQQTSESIEVTALLEPTPLTEVIQTDDEIQLTNVRHWIGGSGYGVGDATEEIATLSIPLSGSTGTISVQRAFEIRVTGGVRETAIVSFTFPITLFE